MPVSDLERCRCKKSNSIETSQGSEEAEAQKSRENRIPGDEKATASPARVDANSNGIPSSIIWVSHQARYSIQRLIGVDQPAMYW